MVIQFVVSGQWSVVRPQPEVRSQYMVAALAPGDYELQVVTQGTNGSILLKEPRTEQLDSILSVQ
ncbi:hypothetical protein KDU71_22235 [Carboxylicivirga sediminis]|uniref:DUF4397 domain-containing protein n=1 Tax=Carboxylicivirga sediminis TaxID=2006564 RepID=A0A941IYW0_9BACT|nr:hypothetical protein [Carboxylicivirga sediminis]MBR8538306.1 hypothetical protein [Carboxylicivirga sediminis]